MKTDDPVSTPKQALEQLQMAVINCRRSGIGIRVAPYYGADEREKMILVLAGVKLVDGRLVPA
jgi:hypothetical protein